MRILARNGLFEYTSDIPGHTKFFLLPCKDGSLEYELRSDGKLVIRKTALDARACVLFAAAHVLLETAVITEEECSSVVDRIYAAIAYGSTN